MEPTVTISLEDAREILNAHQRGRWIDLNVARRLTLALNAAERQAVADAALNPNDGTDDRTPAKPDCSDYDCPDPDNDEHVNDCPEYATDGFREHG